MQRERKNLHLTPAAFIYHQPESGGYTIGRIISLGKYMQTYTTECGLIHVRWKKETNHIKLNQAKISKSKQVKSLMLDIQKQRTSERKKERKKMMKLMH